MRPRGQWRDLLRAGLWVWMAGIFLFTATLQAQTLELASARPDLGRVSYAMDFDQLGHRNAIPLRGVDGRRGIAFGVRADQEVKKLVLDLAYLRSAALLEDYSHLNVLLNGEVISSILLLEENHSSTTLNRAEVALPTRLLRPHNTLELQLIGHYTLACENPVHPDLWADIAIQSRLLFEVEPVLLPDELSLLPVPFFDAHDARRLTLPFVLFNPNPTQLEAASVLASWFGALADYRGAHFPVSTDSFPTQGHAVMIGNNAQHLSRIGLAAPQGPTVAIRTNPNDPAGKLLVITGRNDQEIRQAAVSVALGGMAMAGDLVKVQDLEMEARRPYDAPRWLPADRPVALGELVPVQDLTRDGYAPAPIIVGMRLPPDLSDWRHTHVPINLLYRHSATANSRGNVLDVAVDYYPVRRIQLADNNEIGRQWLSGNESILQRRIMVPLATLGSAPSMQFQFNYTLPPQGECRGALTEIQRSAIDPESTIDLSNFSHFKEMPDLAAFMTAGFPYTRMADLSETVVFLPRHAGDAEYTVLLDLMGIAGRSTGVAVTGLEVRSGVDNQEALEDRDILLIESRMPSQLLEQWRDQVPRIDPAVREAAAFSGEAASPSPVEWKLGHAIDWASRQINRNVMAARQEATLVAPGQVYLAGFESPLSARRSVIVLAAGTGEQMMDAVRLLLEDDRQVAAVQGSLVALNGRTAETLSVDKSYRSGRLTWHETILFFFAHNPLALLGGYLVCALLVSAVMYLALRARARARLRVKHDDVQ